MHTHRCVLTAISMKIGMLIFCDVIICTATVPGTHFSEGGFQGQYHPQSPRVEAHKIISGPLGMSGTPIILQTALTTLPQVDFL